MFRGVDFDLKEVFNLHDLLEIWLSNQSLESVLHFRDLYFYGYGQYNRTKLANGFADKELADTLRNWLDSEIVKQKFADTIEQLIIEEVKFANTDLNELNLLYDILRTKNNG